MHIKSNGRAKPCRDHTGREFPSIEAMARAWNAPAEIVRRRLLRGWSPELALTTAPGNSRYPRRVIDPETGYEYPSAAALARAVGIPEYRVQYRALIGLSPAEIACDADLRSVPSRDHLGRDFPSIEAMAAAWGINAQTLRSRLRHGWLIERALTAPRTPTGRHAKKGGTHEGN